MTGNLTTSCESTHMNSSPKKYYGRSSGIATTAVENVESEDDTSTSL